MRPKLLALKQPFKPLFFLLTCVFLALNTQASSNFDDDSIQNLEETLEKQQKDVEQIVNRFEKMGFSQDDLQRIQEESGGDFSKMVEQLSRTHKGAGQDGEVPSFRDLIDGDAQSLVRDFLEHFSHLSEAELISLLEGAVSFQEGSGNYIKRLLDNKPEVLQFVARLLHHPEALPKAASIIDQRQKLFYFLMANIAVFIFSFFYKRYQRLRNPRAFLTVAMKQWFSRLLLMTFIRLSILIGFFGSQLAPGFKIFRSTFF